MKINENLLKSEKSISVGFEAKFIAKSLALSDEIIPKPLMLVGTEHHILV